MARELVVRLWCDGPHDSSVEATIPEFPLLDWNSGKVRAVDLCSECHSSLTSVLQSFLDKGRAPDEPPKPPTDVESVSMRTCPECQFVSASRGALGIHLRRSHAKSLRDYTWE